MKIILQREVQNLGTPGQVVEVADGYARNYLLPRGMAVPATKGAIRHGERLKLVHEDRVRKAVAVAEEFAAELKSRPIRLAWQAGEDGKLFGSITAQRLAEEISKSAGREIDRKRIHLEEPIRSVGTHEVRVHLHPEVNSTVTVDVVPL
jgi:large subunit ribosomal protein L9